MSRLTKKFNGEYYRTEAKTIMFNNETDYNAIQKLGKLEDIMEYFKINSIDQLINILEAWYAVKPEIYKGMEIRGKYHHKAIFINRKVYIEGTEQYNTLKQALEVEDGNK